jgi:hypothetical protein
MPGLLSIVELMLTLAGMAVVPLIVMDVGTVQVGALAGFGIVVVTAQERFTCPVKPPEGMIVTREVFPLFAPGPMVMLPPLYIANDGTGVLLTMTFKVDAALIVAAFVSSPSRAIV